MHADQNNNTLTRQEQYHHDVVSVSDNSTTRSINYHTTVYTTVFVCRDKGFFHAIIASNRWLRAQVQVQV